MEAYIDNMLVKSKQAYTHVSDLTIDFFILSQYWIKPNPKKFAFKLT